MTEKILLDTNVYRKLLSGDQLSYSYITNAEIIYVSPIVIGELYSGFYEGTKFNENTEILRKFLTKSTIRVLPISFETAQIYSEIKNELKKRGTPIPINDVWIAASTVETGAVLISYDKHFLKIPGLRTWYHLKEI